MVRLTTPLLSVTRGRWPLTSNCTFFARLPSGRRTATCWRRRGNELAQRALHHHRIGEVDQVHGHRILLPPHGHIQHAGTGHGHRARFVGRPIHRVAQQLAMVRRQNLPEGAVDVPREVHHAAAPRLAHVQLREYRSWARAETLPPWAGRDKRESASAAHRRRPRRGCARGTRR